MSVIVPVFNAEPYLSRCLESLHQQKYNNLQILLVDDGSVDASLKLCRQHAVDDTRMLVFHQENKGVSAARNYGLALATGEYVTFVDADDWIDPLHIQMLVQGLQSRKSDCCICGYWLEYPRQAEQRCYPQLSALSGDQAIKHMLSPYLFQGFLCNKLFSVHLIRQYDMQLCDSIYYLEDMLFCATYFSYCNSVCCIEFAGYHYRQHAESAVRKSAVTSEWLERRMTAVLALKRIQTLCCEPETRRLCEGRWYLEHADILRNVLVFDGGYHKSASTLKEIVRKGVFFILCTPLSMKEKLKYVATALCPKSASVYLAARNRKYL